MSQKHDLLGFLHTYDEIIDHLASHVCVGIDAATEQEDKDRLDVLEETLRAVKEDLVLHKRDILRGLSPEDLETMCTLIHQSLGKLPKLAPSPVDNNRKRVLEKQKQEILFPEPLEDKSYFLIPKSYLKPGHQASKLFPKKDKYDESDTFSQTYETHLDKKKKYLCDTCGVLLSMAFSSVKGGKWAQCQHKYGVVHSLRCCKGVEDSPCNYKSLSSIRQSLYKHPKRDFMAYPASFLDILLVFPVTLNQDGRVFTHNVIQGGSRIPVPYEPEVLMVTTVWGDYLLYAPKNEQNLSLVNAEPDYHVKGGVIALEKGDYPDLAEFRISAEEGQKTLPLAKG